MYIDNYKNDAGEYVGQDGETFGTAEAFIVHALGFCECGAPDLAIRYVRDALQLVHDQEHKLWEKSITYEQWTESVRRVLGSDGAEYFMWYWLQKKGFAEHGGSVPGWLTTDGEEWLADLNEFLADENDII